MSGELCPAIQFCADEAVKLIDLGGVHRASQSVVEEFGPQSPADLEPGTEVARLVGELVAGVVEGTDIITAAIRDFHARVNQVPRPDCLTCPLRSDSTLA